MTVSQRRVENCSCRVQFCSQSRVELRSCRIEPIRQHCRHDRLPTRILCVASPLTRNIGKPVGQATLPFSFVVSSMGLANPDTSPPVGWQSEKGRHMYYCTRHQKMLKASVNSIPEHNRFRSLLTIDEHRTPQMHLGRICRQPLPYSIPIVIHKSIAIHCRHRQSASSIDFHRRRL